MKKTVLLTCFVMMFAAAAQAGKDKKAKKAERDPASASESAAPKFSAFTFANTLYVTVMTDGCNNVGGQLEVAASCRKDRVTRNAVVGCAVEVQGISTMMGCPEGTQPKPQIMEFKLADTMVDPRAQYLVIRYGGEAVRIGINR